MHSRSPIRRPSFGDRFRDHSSLACAILPVISYAYLPCSIPVPGIHDNTLKAMADGFKLYASQIQAVSDQLTISSNGKGDVQGAASILVLSCGVPRRVSLVTIDPQMIRNDTGPLDV